MSRRRLLGKRKLRRISLIGTIETQSYPGLRPHGLDHRVILRPRSSRVGNLEDVRTGDPRPPDGSGAVTPQKARTVTPEVVSSVLPDALGGQVREAIREVHTRLSTYPVQQGIERVKA